MIVNVFFTKFLFNAKELHIIESFEKLNSNGWIESFRTKCLLIFGPLESMSEEIKARNWNQNFVLFLNMGLEILCWVLFEISKGIFERPKKLVWTEIVPHFSVFSLLPFKTKSWNLC